MTIRIADCDGLWEIEVPLSEPMAESLRLQFERVSANEAAFPEVAERVGYRITDALADALEPDLRPPSEAQINYAVAIARELSVNLPSEALKYRGSMKEFLDRFVPVFKSKSADFR